MSEITHGGDQLLRLVYGELGRIAGAMLAREKPGHTLEPTVLVHDAWLRLVDGDGGVKFESRAHLVSAAAGAMRWLLIDAARRRLAACHGGGQERVAFDGIEIAAPKSDDSVQSVHEALERLTRIDAEKAEVVKLRYLRGLSIQETAELLGISERTVRRHWTFARAWLSVSIRQGI